MVHASVSAFIKLFYIYIASLTITLTCFTNDRIIVQAVLVAAVNANELQDPEIGSALDPHPDPNDESHPSMIYIGATEGHPIHGRRIPASEPNGIRFIFGTSFDETHKDIEEKDLDLRNNHTHFQDLPRSREEIIKQRHGEVSPEGPKPFGYHDTHELDGGMLPPKVVYVDPFWLDEAPVTNKEFGIFVRSIYYKTEAENFGWSFVLSSFIPNNDGSSSLSNEDMERDPEAEHWVVVQGAYWREPEGPGSSYKYREHHPVVHVTHRDAAEYCEWKGKRLPGEREWEAAARAGHYGPTNRTLYAWGESEDVEVWKDHANLWGDGEFPDENLAEDGWRGTSPVRNFPANNYGFYDMTGNVWEWMRGGKHKDRIVRGGSYVDSTDGSVNHAATLGARETLHGTTSTGNVGFRCAKAVKRRVEYHYKEHDESVHGQLTVEDEFGKQHMVPQRNWEDQFVVPEDEDDDGRDEIDEFDGDTGVLKIKKRKVAVPRTTRSNEL